MLGILLLAAGMSVAPPAKPRKPRPLPRAIEQRVALLEAKEILQSQQLWSMQARLPPEALKALEDVQLHLLRDQEQDERVRVLTAEVAALSQRLATMELMLRSGVPEASTVIPVAPTQTSIEPKAKAKKRKPKKRRADD